MQEFIEGIVTNPFFSVFTLFFGGWLGHKLNICQDRRKEFNDAAEILLKELRDDKIWPEFESFRRRLPWWKLRSFDDCVTKYKEARGENNKVRDKFYRVSHKDQSLLESTKEEMIKFTKRQ